VAGTWNYASTAEKLSLGIFMVLILLEWTSSHALIPCVSTFVEILVFFDAFFIYVFIVAQRLKLFPIWCVM